MDPPAKVVVGFVDKAVNRLLDLDKQREVALTLVPVGHTSDAIARPAPDVGPLALETAPISDYEFEFPAILEMHQASSLMDEGEVAAWRGEVPPLVTPIASGQLFPLQREGRDRYSP